MHQMDNSEFTHRARKRIKEVKRKARPGESDRLNLTFQQVNVIARTPQN